MPLLLRVQAVTITTGLLQTDILHQLLAVTPNISPVTL